MNNSWNHQISLRKCSIRDYILRVNIFKTHPSTIIHSIIEFSVSSFFGLARYSSISVGNYGPKNWYRRDRILLTLKQKKRLEKIFSQYVLEGRGPYIRKLIIKGKYGKLLDLNNIMHMNPLYHINKLILTEQLNPIGKGVKYIEFVREAKKSRKAWNRVINKLIHR